MTKPLLILAAALSIGLCPASAQAIHTFRYTTLDGLPTGVVYDVTQLEDDSVWIATGRGVARFDGHEWRQCGAPAVAWRWIAPDGRGGAWVAGLRAQEGLARLDSRGVVTSRTPFPDVVDEMLLTGPIARFRDARGRDGLAVALRRHGFWFLVDGAWERLDTCGRQAVAHAVVGRTPDESWGCSDGGIVVWSARAGTRRIVPSEAGAPDDCVLTVAFETSGGLPWLVGRTWVGRLGEDGLEHLVRTRPFTEPPSISPDAPYGVYFGDPSALWHLDSTTSIVRELGVNEEMAAAGCLGIHRDRDDNVWAASSRGVTRIPPLRFHEFDSRHGLLEDEVTAIEFVGDRIVFGHNIGLSWLDGGRFHTWRLPVERGENCRVLDLEADGRGGVWLAADQAGLWRLGADGNATPFADAASGPPVLALHVDGDGVVWRGTESHGIQRLLGDRFVPANEGLPHSLNVRRIEAAPGGELFVATMEHGLFRGRPGRWARITGPAASSVYAVTRYRGRMLMGTRVGLMVVEGDVARHATLDGNTFENSTYALHVDPKGVLWCGTDRGLYAWDGMHWSVFTPRNGLAGREINRDALATDAAGHMWIGTDDGLSLYLGERRRPPRPPRLRIVATTAGGRDVGNGEIVDVASSDDTLAFRIKTMSFVDDGRVDVTWRLAGHDDDWRTADAEHAEELIYSNLSPGRYRLEVRAANARNEWSETVRSPEIVIPAPFWRRTWFIAAALVGVGLLGWMLAAFVVARRERSRLERVVRERTEELLALQRDLHRAEKLSALGQLAGGVAHDFNNLLTAIVGGCEMLSAALPSDHPLMKDIEPIERAAHSGAELVEKLLAIGRRQRANPEPTDLGRSLREIGRVARRVLGDGVAVEVRTGVEPVVALIDRGRLDHVIMNLLINARDAMPAGGRVELSCGIVELAAGDVESLPAGSYARMVVRDEGAGIPDEVVDCIFEPFFTTKQPGQGTGLGLAMVYGAVRQAGGDVTVATRVGRGTTFTLYLPESPRAPAPASEHGTGTNRCDGCAVLVVDDEHIVRDLIERMARQLGCAVTTAADAAEALELTAAGRFDVLLTDVAMPDMSGPELAREVVRRCPGIRVCFMTGYADLGRVGHELPEDALVLKKPFRLGELRDRLAPAADVAAQADS